MDFLSPQTQAYLTVAGVVLSLIAVLLAATGPVFGRVRKELAFGFSSRCLLEHPNVDIQELQITYDGEKVTRVDLLNIYAMNTGNIPINVSDFQDCIRVHFPENLKIHSWSRNKSRPDKLGISVSQAENKAELCIEPLLLNPNDYFSIFFVVSGVKPHVKPSIRIAGIASPRLLLAGPNYSWLLLMPPLVLILGVFSMVGSIVSTWQGLLPSSWAGVMPLLLLLLVLVAAGLMLRRNFGFFTARRLGKGTEDIGFHSLD